MSSFPDLSFPTLGTVTTNSLECLGGTQVYVNGITVSAANSQTFPLANRAFLYPFTLGAISIARQLFWVNGAAVNGNVDAGIYTAEFERIVSTGSTAQAGTNAIQAVAVAATTLRPGRYYLALACDNVVATFWSTANVTELNRVMGNINQAAAFPLPAVITPAMAVTGVMLVGYSENTVL